MCASEAGADGGVIGDATAEQVADEGFDGVGFVEGHLLSPSNRKRFCMDLMTISGLCLIPQDERIGCEGEQSSMRISFGGIGPGF